jgi:hypothetical protein
VVTSSSTRRMIGRIEETSASFEARSAPRSYPTEGPGVQLPGSTRHERLGGASGRSSHVRNAPLATVGPKKAAGRDGPLNETARAVGVLDV